MMIMGFTEASRMFRDVWRLYRQYAVRKLDEKELEEFVRKASTAYKKYTTPFAKEMFVAVVGEIERTVKFYDIQTKKEAAYEN